MSSHASQDDPTTPRAITPVRPEPIALQGNQSGGERTVSTLRPVTDTAPGARKKKRNHRGGKKKRTRRQSFAAPASEDGSGMPETSQGQMRRESQSAARSSLYRLQGRNNSSTSLESEALLDHRDQPSMRPRRSSTLQNMQSYEGSHRPTYTNPFVSSENQSKRNLRSRDSKSARNSLDDEEVEDAGDERAPLLSESVRARSFGPYGGDSKKQGLRSRRTSSKSSSRSKSKKTIFDRHPTLYPQQDKYNVNYPPSVPGSPELGPSNRDMSFGEVLVRDDFAPSRSSPRGVDSEFAVDFNESGSEGSVPATPRREGGYEGRRHTIALQAEEDVCFPIEGMSEIAEEDELRTHDGGFRQGAPGPRRRRGKWPDLAMLDEWSRMEKEGRSEERRVRKITEPQLIGGRLRPIHKGWHRAEDDAPYRFTYFNEEFQSTIHSQSISELVQPGGSFRELFVPDPPELEDSSSEDEKDDPAYATASYLRHSTLGANGDSKPPTRQGSMTEDPRSDSRLGSSTVGDTQRSQRSSTETSGQQSPSDKKLPVAHEKDKPKRYGDRPTWWLDVLSPNDAEMKVLSKTFGIHPLTAEDIMMQEAREKVELFRNYYFVNYRTFEQDMNNEDFLEPVNMYVIVFREGVISFHFSMTPHPANVRRRIRQLKDYLILSSDWISYAIIDDITDVFAPLIQSIEDEVDDIDDAILQLHSSKDEEMEKNKRNSKDNEKRSDAGDGTSGESGGDMLRRVGDCRKKVMGLYRLLGNKADVIKGFAKRCNEHWEVAPRSEIGLYLGDIQDHIVTMTGNLSHYEKILARSHGNYLAQINIRMNERQEETADVLGKLTVLGTIVLPMNIITGLWGMNVWVPGQAYEGDLTWFWCLTAGLLVFGLACFFTAKMIYRIV
ncbi:MAG: CorA metal ion transporter [Claussenomyces sp. TS43310]|nr:MAG: CorA metal ion transporter [Claussenomyces sp. TS43310]